MALWSVTGQSVLVEADTEQEAVERAQEGSGWQWEAQRLAGPMRVGMMVEELVRDAKRQDLLPYSTVEGLTASQHMLAGNGPTVWATVVRSNEDNDVVFVVVARYGLGTAEHAVLEGPEAEMLGNWLDWQAGA